jgi:hypothetical protein
MTDGMTGPVKWIEVPILAAFSSVAFAAPGDPEENTWIPSRYYPPGQTVFHQGDWYQSREPHESMTPTAPVIYSAPAGSAPGPFREPGASNQYSCA